MSDASVSVIVTTFNQRPLVGAAIRSVLAQTYGGVDLIVVDDGSTDDTAAYLRRRFGGSIRCFRQENGGQGAARNLGLREARGTHVQFLDADDLILPEKLARQMAVLGGSPALQAVYCDYACFVDEPAPDRWTPGIHRDRCLSGNLWPCLIRGNFLLNHTPVVAIDPVRRVGGFDEDRRLSGCEDYDLWLRLSAAGCRFHYLDEVLALYRQVERSVSHDLDGQRRRTIRVLEKVPSYAGELPRDERSAIDAYVSRLHAFLCLGALRKRRPWAALRHLTGALSYDPGIAVQALRSILRRRQA
jgi:glycosyltransferase involved in cell wall biosynthesis